MTNRPKRDVVVYKMHGDVSNPDDAILTKEQYEQYHQTHEPFINTLTGELTTKTFLFIGFSFTDPNLDYVLSRLNFRFNKSKRQHYCLVKNHIMGEQQNTDQATFEYNSRKQALIINDLKRYGIKSLLVDNYNDITSILTEIERRFKKKTIFIAGSAETYLPYNKLDSVNFIHTLSRKIIENNFRIVNGFGWGVGSSVINGALEPIYQNPLKYSESQLVLRPFPQFESGSKTLPELWEEYRHKMISLSGISIFLFGNKDVNGAIVDANGVIREFEISKELGNLCIPIGCTGYAARIITEMIIENPNDFYNNHEEVLPFINQLNDSETVLIDKVAIIIKLLKLITA